MFMAVWVIMIILNFVWPKQTFSASENRMLAVIPRFSFEDFVSGEYLGGVDSYINDHFAFRDFYLKLNSWWEIDVMGKKKITMCILVKMISYLKNLNMEMKRKIMF